MEGLRGFQLFSDGGCRILLVDFSDFGTSREAAENLGTWQGAEHQGVERTTNRALGHFIDWQESAGRTVLSGVPRRSSTGY